MHTFPAPPSRHTHPAESIPSPVLRRGSSYSLFVVSLSPEVRRGFRLWLVFVLTLLLILSCLSAREFIRVGPFYVMDKALAIAALLAICTISTVNAATNSTAPAQPQCGFVGNGDMYGLGIRLGIYIQGRPIHAESKPYMH